jgi:hypothetical protein
MKRGWLEHNPRRKIPLGCVTLIFPMGVFATILLTVVIPSFRNSDAYKQALAKAAGNSQVREQSENAQAQYRQCESFDPHLRPQSEGLDSRRRLPERRRVAPHLPSGEHRWPAGKHRSVGSPTARRERLLMRPKWALSNALEMETAFLGRTTQVE